MIAAMVGVRFVGGVCVVGLMTVVLAAGCGAKTDLDRPDAPGPDVPSPRPESCDGLDNDLDGVIDNGFRDFATGAYNVLEHCGACGFSCPERVEHAVSTACENVRDVVWACRALECERGYAPTSDRSHCVPWEPLLCRNCADDGDCDVDGGACVDLGGELRCAVSCGPGSPGERACPTGYACTEGLCVPAGGSCSCYPGEFFTVSCDLPTPEGEMCLGRAECRDGVLSDCAGREDICDGIDNDCDGTVDQDFVDVRGVYSVDPRNCGECVIDCTVTSLPGMTLTCGGDPYAPRCRILCTDELDGVQVGDLLDADLDIANGCECTVVTDIDDVADPTAPSARTSTATATAPTASSSARLHVAPDGAGYGARLAVLPDPDDRRGGPPRGGVAGDREPDAGRLRGGGNVRRGRRPAGRRAAARGYRNDLPGARAGGVHHGRGRGRCDDGSGRGGVGAGGRRR